MAGPPPRVGAYGLTITGLASAGETLGLLPIPPSAAWPCLKLTWRLISSPRPPAHRLDHETAIILLIGGEYAELDRRRGTAVVHAVRPLDDHELVHPYLASPAGVMVQWHGRLAFHAGGMVVEGGVWGVLGEKEAGKTTLLAACAAAGHPVLSDDLVVIDGTTAFAGPRTLDLRPETAAQLAGNVDLLPVRGGERARLSLPGIDPELPFRGWLVLKVGDELEVRPVPLHERLRLLSAQLMMGIHDPTRLLDLLALPMSRLTRPHSWRTLPQVVETVSATLSSS